MEIEIEKGTELMMNELTPSPIDAISSSGDPWEMDDDRSQLKRKTNKKQF